MPGFAFQEKSRLSDNSLNRSSQRHCARLAFRPGVWMLAACSWMPSAGLIGPGWLPDASSAYPSLRCVRFGSTLPREYMHNLNESLTCIVFVPLIFLSPRLQHSLDPVAGNLRMIRRCAGDAETTGTCTSSARAVAVAIGLCYSLHIRETWLPQLVRRIGQNRMG
jgi:hypothetical protein